MKKLVAAICIVLMLVSFWVLSACNVDEPFVNPGDNLGGGGVGDIANTVDTSKAETEIDGVISGIFIDRGNESANAVEPIAVDGVVTICESGTYVLKGSYKQVIIDGTNLSVNIILNGVSISCENGVALDGTTSGKKLSVVLTVMENTTNAISNSGDNYNSVHIKGTLAINGSGSLDVNSASKSAIKASKGITVAEVSLTLSAVNHAITGSNIAAADCSINVKSAGKDGINAECDDAAEYVKDDGYVYIKDVDFSCNVKGDGIQADTWLYIDGGNYNIVTNGNFVSNTSANMQQYEMTADDFRYIKSGNTYKKLASDEVNRYSTRYGLTQSAKGIKVGEIKYTDSATDTEVTVTDGDYCIKIVEGNFIINSADDSIHTNSGDVIISGGTFEISTLDDGITADKTTKITNGKITVASSYEGIEGAYVEISGGEIKITSSDDGINAASDDTNVIEHIIISGGNVTVDASGDGLDSNGSILICGGNVIVYGPTNGGDAGLDADRGIVITGGTLFACSSLGMVETPSTNSRQFVVSYAQQSAIAADTVLTIVDSNSNVLYSVTVKKTCQSIILSLPSFEKNASYSIRGNDTTLAAFTISSTITTVGSSGQGMGGRPGGGFGGRPGGR